ncbi:hypothetical protein E1176_06345, partial [Fulvivirga sp. RKSG066]|uniref:tetratricopeptide repeat protein n=1 Tax=Fulvivirga aurantia TaxID=2529383 RepID=UPI0012BCD425
MKGFAISQKLLYSVVISGTLLFLSEICRAQAIWDKVKSTHELADMHYEEGNYEKAIELYRHLVINQKANNTVFVRLGRMSYALNDYKTSVKWFERYKNTTPLTQDDLLMYANALAGTGRLSEAADTYTSYMDKYGTNDWLALKVWRLNNLSYLYEDSLTYSVKPTSVNSEFSEIPMAYYNDGLLFISDRDQSFQAKNHTTKSTGRSPYALYQTVNLWPSTSTSLQKVEIEPSNLIRKGGYHVAGLSFSENDGQMVYAKNVKMADDLKQPLQLFTKSIEESTEGKRIGFGESKFSIKHPSISPDGNTLYFSAELPDSYGGFDLYKSNHSNGTWSEPVNLGPSINTPGNEAFPFMHKSGVLYFSSDGLPGFGGYDLFKIDINNTTAEPQNMGYPLNSSADDFSLILNGIGDRGHFASNRRMGGLNDDIFVVEIDLQEYPLTIKGLLKFKN